MRQPYTVFTDMKRSDSVWRCTQALCTTAALRYIAFRYLWSDVHSESSLCGAEWGWNGMAGGGRRRGAHRQHAASTPPPPRVPPASAEACRPSPAEV